MLERVCEVAGNAVSDTGPTEVIRIDHARMAAAAGVEMQPFRLRLFSNPRLIATILNGLQTTMLLKPLPG